MELSEQTINVLNNFKTIQANVVFREGNTINTMSSAKNIMAEAKLDIDIPSEFGIYDLNEFLGTLNLVDSPKLDLKDEYALIQSTSGRSRIKYYFAAPELLIHPTKTIKMPSTEVKFKLDEATLSRLKRAAATLGHETLEITPDRSGNELSQNVLNLRVCDIENSTSNDFSIDVASDDFEGDFKFHISLNNLKLMAVDYEVSISKKLISNFNSLDPNVPIQYWIALEKTSKA
jgi:hypothetical protein